jgi:hypothetical protein
MRGVKTIEFRSRATRIRGRVYIYASLGRYSAREAARMMKGYGIDDVDIDDLPRGVVIGTVELYDCDGAIGMFETRSGQGGYGNLGIARSRCGSIRFEYLECRHPRCEYREELNF